MEETLMAAKVAALEHLGRRVYMPGRSGEKDRPPWAVGISVL